MVQSTCQLRFLPIHYIHQQSPVRIKKFYILLLAIVASVGLSYAATEVTITKYDFPNWGNSVTKDGVTVSAAGYIDGEVGDIVGGGSFSTTLGNFTKIEVYATEVSPLGEGWSGNSQSQTWTGNASSVSFGDDILGNGGAVTLKFTIGDAAPATARPLAEATAEDLGKIVGADGNIYDTKDAAEAAGTTAVAMIAYVGSDTDHATYKQGLAIALADESDLDWSTAKSTCEGKSAVTNAAWLLPSQNQWKAMFKANGGSEESYDGLNTAVATAGGDSSKLQKNERYWSSSEQGSNFAWVLVLGEDSAGWDGAPEDLGHHVRACLAF